MAKVEIKGKEYEVRELMFDDVCNLSLILEKTEFDISKFRKKVNISELRRAMGDGETDVTNEQVWENMGIEVLIEMVGHIIRNYHKAHKEVSEWLGSFIGVKQAEFRKMPINTPFVIFKALAEDNDLVDFFKSVTG